MRYFFLLLLLFFLCFGPGSTVDAQNITITASIGLASDQCNPVINDPNTDCINVSDGMDMLTYLPGEDGEIIVTYRLTNNSAGTIAQALIVDSERGVIVPVSTVNIPPGVTVTANRVYPAETAPGTTVATVTATLESAGGLGLTVQSEYTLEVVAPEVTTDFSLVRKIDACPTDVIAPECTGQNYGNFSITVGATDTVVTRFNWENSGLSTYDQSTLTDQDGAELASTGFDQAPGQELISAQYIVAPNAPGTYPRSQTITVTDFAGNTDTKTINYTIIVEAPELEVDFSLLRKLDACPTDVIAPECAGQNYGNFTITVGATDTVVTRFDWENAGLGTFDQSTLTDQDGEILASTGFNQVTGQRLISAQYIVAPSQIGTHNFSQTITVTDFGGNTATETINYTIIVEAPQLETDFSLVRKIDVCPTDVIAPECAGQNYGNFTITVGATDTVVTRFDWENAGLGTFDQSTLTDQDGEILASTGFNQVTGQRLISAQYIVAPSQIGTHNFSQTIIVTDFGGNTATETINYTIIVEAPQLETDFSLVRKKDACPTDVVAPECGVTNYGNTFLRVGAADTILTRFDWENAGLGTFDLSVLTDQDGEELASTGFNHVTGQRLISAQYLVSPGEPGIYNWSQTITVTDFGGNVATETINYTIEVDCRIGDWADPVALCRDRTITLAEGETRTVNAGQINDGSFDACGALAGGNIDISTFTCADEGPNTVTLTVEDLSGNSASCTSTVTVVVEDLIAEGIAGNCLSETHTVAGGQTVNDLTINGQLVAQVIISGNNIDEVQVDLYKGNDMTEDLGGTSFLSKRIALTMLNNGQEVQPDTDPVIVRLYYTVEELNALQAATPGSSEATFTVIKTSDDDCGTGYSGQSNAGMNTSTVAVGCAGADRYFQFFTGTFSTFYLFANELALPVELTEFTATPLSKARVQLDWMTQSESGNSHFEIERSTDGRNFMYLGAVAGAGDSERAVWYGFVDEAAATGRNYYRLRQVDFDGTETLSEVRQVMVEGEARLSVFPNPVSNKLRLAGFAGGPVRILDGQGRLLLEQQLREGESLPVDYLKPGFYLLQTPAETIRWIKN